MLDFNPRDDIDREVTEAWVVYRGVCEVIEEVEEIFLDSRVVPPYLEFLYELERKYRKKYLDTYIDYEMERRK